MYLHLRNKAQVIYKPELLKEQYYLQFYLIFSQLTNSTISNTPVAKYANDKTIFTTHNDSFIVPNNLQNHFDLPSTWYTEWRDGESKLVHLNHRT